MTSCVAKNEAISLGSIGGREGSSYKVTGIQQSVGDGTSGFTRCSNEQNLGGHNLFRFKMEMVRCCSDKRARFDGGGRSKGKKERETGIG
jgi:hypothetical protein